MNNVFDINTESVFPDVLKWRRHIHANPDLSFHEKPTADYIHEQLSNLKNIEITRPMDNSVIVMLRGRHDGPTWALRADIDALPLTQAHEASYDIDWKSGYTVGRNHPEACAWVRKALCSHFPTGTLKESHKPIFSSEDFSSYQEKVPGCFVFVGCGNPEKGAVWNVHNPHFLIDEDALKLGVKTHLALVSALLPEM